MRQKMDESLVSADRHGAALHSHHPGRQCEGVLQKQEKDKWGGGVQGGQIECIFLYNCHLYLL